jgi:hypothetical protein
VKRAAEQRELVNLVVWFRNWSYSLRSAWVLNASRHRCAARVGEQGAQARSASHFPAFFGPVFGHRHPAAPSHVLNADFQHPQLVARQMRIITNP